MIRHLTQRHLAQRWAMSERTLESWRWRRVGPDYLRLGGRIVYRLADVEAFEHEQLRSSASRSGAHGARAG